MNRTLVMAGVSFRTSGLSLRSRFAFNADACRDAYSNTRDPLSFFILSTCNRTEIYSWNTDFDRVLDILRCQAQCTMDEVRSVSYLRQGDDAVHHFFRVAAGLDSQIIGDYDIISQVKAAFRGAKEYGRTNGLLEKLVNFGLQASKEVKNKTSFSDGTLSVPYAVVKHLGTESDVRTVTVVGAGETGELMIRYLRSYMPGTTIRLVNRDEEKLHSIGSRYEVLQFPIAALPQSLIGADVLIVTTNAAAPIVEREHLAPGVRLVFDLSVPRNVSTRIYNMPGIRVYDTDRISETIQTNFNSRLSEIPKVEEILRKAGDDFSAWLQRRQTYRLEAETR